MSIAAPIVLSTIAADYPIFQFDPFFWRRSVSMGQFNEFSSSVAASGTGVKEDDDDDVSTKAADETKKKNVLHPLSLHLSIYKPQLSSTT
ncbi:hypothetical protein PHJA_002219500 [Phtheirospermum japonicum]|uniref:Uncharacterized protein n=1 Tax=Phtheirospermum japonicum TaxID=374723 RepID=A0A830D0I4_9LAMI|nr:hypothetical protein PHJA_002219500 [Phtheirospermum japonicum]